MRADSLDRRLIELLGFDTTEAFCNQEFDLFPTKLQPLLLSNNVHTAVQPTNLPQQGSPRTAEMIAAARRISVEYESDFPIIRFA